MRLLLLPLLALAFASASVFAVSPSPFPSPFSSPSPSSSSSNATWSIRHHLATKTAYWSASPASPPASPPFSSCSVVGLNLLARHGARYPSLKDMQALEQLATDLQPYASLLAPSYAWLGSWSSPYEYAKADLLTLTGQREHYDLAGRLMAALDPLLSQAYEPYTYAMQCSQVSRACRSGSAFGYRMQEANGLLEGPHTFMPFYLYSDSLHTDLDLRFFDNCPAYTTHVKHNPNATLEASLYERTRVQDVADYLSRVSGLYPQYNLTTGEVALMFKQCGYEVAIAGSQGAFCTLFDPLSASVLEYYNDVKAYYTKAYGHALNYMPACRLLQDFFSSFDAMAHDSLKAKLRFGHAETLLPLVSLFNLFRDPEPLLASWSDEQIEQRLFRTSVISPFAANLQAVLHQCDSRLYVRLLVNEREVLVPGCPSVYCPLPTLSSLLHDALACNYADICRL